MLPLDWLERHLDRTELAQRLGAPSAPHPRGCVARARPARIKELIMTEVTSTQLAPAPLPVQLLWERGWPPAAQLFWSQIDGIEGVPRDDFAADFWSATKDRCKVASSRLADLLFAAGRGADALAALMLAADPTEPQTFEIVLPQLVYAIEHVWEWPTATATRHAALQRLGVWWRAARGDFEADDRSIFLIARLETPDQDDPREGLPPPSEQTPSQDEEGRQPDVGPGLVVMPKDKATKLNNYQSEFKELADARLPLRSACNLSEVRKTLMAEYPHATTAIDLVLRDLREGEPIRLKPLLLTGPAGTGKSRLVRRLGDLLGIGVYRYDGSGASDNMFSGSPKAWGNTVPSAPARAVNQTRIANPIVMIDEIDKAGRSSRNGRLWDALLPFMERETAARYRDVSLDAELDLSWITYVATANTIEDLPDPLKDRYRIVKIPAPTLRELPLLAANVLQELAVEAGEQGFFAPLAGDELEVIARAWQKAGFSIRSLQKIVAATIDARNATAPRH
jgi:ATP-dependent Lon protease